MNQVDIIDRNKFQVSPPTLDVDVNLFCKDRLLETSLRKDHPVVLDLFAGAGGLSIGFKAAGFKVIGACELDEWACDMIKHNFPDEKYFQET